MYLIRKNRERHGRSREAGFTLIEVVLSVAILGIVSAALLGVVLQYAKTTADTQARLIESTDQQFISTYWQSDVSSLGRRSFNAGSFDIAQSVFLGAAGPGGCGSSVAGSPVVAFAWNEFASDAATPAGAWDKTPHEVAYVAVSKGSKFKLKRVRCVAGAASPAETVARNLTSKPTISCDTTCTSATLPNRVSMTFTVKDADNDKSVGYTTTVSADRRQG